MTVAKIAYLTSPAPNRFILNYQEEGQENICRVEISKPHLTNLIIDGASFAFRESSNHRVPEASPTESANNERAGA